MINFPNLQIHQSPLISLEMIDSRVLKIIDVLHNNGFQAYLVGGCVRDMLLGRTPKDFDVVSDARPEQICKLFSNCRLVGRRFLLAHIYYGHEKIEVATFRAASDKTNYTDENGKVLEDNNYGTIEEDVIRRDFTINSLYFDIKNQQIYDYLGAIDDINNRQLNMIGDPEIRFNEDPVRMLRAIRFASKLDLQISEQLNKAIIQSKELLSKVQPSRLFDECQKLLIGGYGKKCVELLTKYDLFAWLFPDSARALNYNNTDFANYANKLLYLALENSDYRINSRKSVSTTFLLAAILWPVFQLQYRGMLAENSNWQSAISQASEIVFLAANQRVAIPARLREVIQEIWLLQARLQTAVSNQKKIRSVLAAPRFRSAYDFLALRAKAGENVEKLALKWEEIQLDGKYDQKAFNNNLPKNKNSTNHSKSRKIKK